MSENNQPTDEDVAQRASQLIAGYGWQTVRTGAVAAWVRAWRAAGGRLSGPEALDRVCLRAAAVQLSAGVRRARRPALTTGRRLRPVERDLEKYLTGVAARLLQLSPEEGWDGVVRATVTALTVHPEECADPQLFLAWAVSLLSQHRQQAVRAGLEPGAGVPPPAEPPVPTSPGPTAPQPSTQERALLLQYAHTAASAERAQILRQLVGELTPAARVAGRARLQAWVADLPPPALVGSHAYTRYRQLLPQALAGLLDPSDGPYREFRELLDEWDACREEYQDLAQAMAAGSHLAPSDPPRRSHPADADAAT